MHAVDRTNETKTSTDSRCDRTNKCVSRWRSPSQQQNLKAKNATVPLCTLACTRMAGKKSVPAYVPLKAWKRDRGVPVHETMKEISYLHPLAGRVPAEPPPVHPVRHGRGLPPTPGLHGPNLPAHRGRRRPRAPLTAPTGTAAVGLAASAPTAAVSALPAGGPVVSAAAAAAPAPPAGGRTVSRRRRFHGRWRLELGGRCARGGAAGAGATALGVAARSAAAGAVGAGSSGASGASAGLATGAARAAGTASCCGRGVGGGREAGASGGGGSVFFVA